MPSQEKTTVVKFPELKEPVLFNVGRLAHNPQLMKALARGTYEDRLQQAVKVSQATSETVLEVESMTSLEHWMSTLFLAFGVPVAVFNIPLVLYLVGRFVVGNVTIMFQGFFVLVFIPLLLLPQTFHPHLLESWWSMCMLKYFSWTFVIEEFPNPNRPRILVGPPHGVFP